jgi:hypothetical protein
MRSINTGCTHCPSPADVDFADKDGLRPMCLACLRILLGRLVRHDIRGTWLVTTPPAPVPAETVTA